MRGHDVRRARPAFKPRAAGVQLVVDRVARRDATPAALTDRQREVLGLMAEGLTNAAIARRLFLTEKAVVQHCSNIYAALDLAHNTDEHRRVLAVIRHLATQEEEDGRRVTAG